MWQLACISPVWFLLRGDEIILMARYGKIFSVDGEFLLNGKLYAHARMNLGVPEQIDRLALTEEAVQRCMAARAKLPPLEPRVARDDPRTNWGSENEHKVETAPPREEKLRKPVVARSPQAQPPNVSPERRAEMEAAKKEREQARAFREVVRKVANELGTNKCFDYSNFMVVYGLDDNGRECRVKVEGFDIQPFPEKDAPVGTKTTARNTWFAEKLMKLAIERVDQEAKAEEEEKRKKEKTDIDCLLDSKQPTDEVPVA